MNGSTMHDGFGTSTGAEAEVVRCFECRQLWPHSAMRRGVRSRGPVWFGVQMSVLRCPDCLPA